MFTGIIAGTGTVLETAPMARPGASRLLTSTADRTALADGGSPAVCRAGQAEGADS
ncbi:hypothetical protein ACSL103130_12860 [Actinomyces slackii]|uniref:Riboflavin synthase n=1 Tax=Actinomyces slackii TaxID=52774 RepID=A0A448K9S4_9ACTO|nr:hypothetical protein [Actinomyces slackii]VEG73699.1 Uncharacterised protein [Actinomyces slackii]